MSDSPLRQPLVIVGAGGMAREIAWLVADINKEIPERWQLIGFWDKDHNSGATIHGVPVIDEEAVKSWLPDVWAIVAIGNPVIREHAVARVKQLGCRLATLVHPSVRYDQSSVSIGEGTMICAGTILTVDVSVGSNVLINLDCTITHDCVIEDFATLSPGVHLSGHTIIRRGAYVGAGAVTVEDHEIGTQSTVGAGAVVVTDIPADVTAVGVPAKVSRR